ncbi:MAG: hypothetical protein K9N51_13190 [Candidatus Pacebacteria bacterium]|nr:hypothetical protein [Candidatus Paceibacterota bacterium]
MVNQLNTNESGRWMRERFCGEKAEGQMVAQRRSSRRTAVIASVLVAGLVTADIVNAESIRLSLAPTSSRSAGKHSVSQPADDNAERITTEETSAPNNKDSTANPSNHENATDPESASTKEQTSNGATTESMPDNARSWSDIVEVLNLLANKGILNSTDTKDHQRVIEAILQAVGYGTRLGDSPTSEPIQGNTENQPTEAFHGHVMLKNIFAYWRLPSLTKDGTKQIISSLTTSFDDERPEGIVLDLRCADGNYPNGTLAVATALSQAERPLTVLVNGETSGSSELLAFVLKGRENTVLVGSATKGNPFPFEEYELTSGHVIYIPSKGVPGAETLWPPISVKPDLHVKDSIACEDIGKLINGDVSPTDQLAQDKALRRAIDLLSMVRGLSQQQDEPSE